MPYTNISGLVVPVEGAGGTAWHSISGKHDLHMLNASIIQAPLRPHFAWHSISGKHDLHMLNASIIQAPLRPHFVSTPPPPTTYSYGPA